MAFRPLHDRVVVQALDSESKPLEEVIPDTAKEKPSQGKVISVGPVPGTMTVKSYLLI